MAGIASYAIHRTCCIRGSKPAIVRSSTSHRGTTTGRHFRCASAQKPFTTESTENTEKYKNNNTTTDANIIVVMHHFLSCLLCIFSVFSVLSVVKGFSLL